VLLENPSTNSASLVCFENQIYCGTANQLAEFKYYWNPTISSNGTVQTIENLRNNIKIPPSTMKAYYAPTISANGVLFSIYNTANVQTTSRIPMIIDPGNSLLVTCTTASSSNIVFSQFFWFEVNL
jgi:hypothetical protein